MVLQHKCQSFQLAILYHVSEVLAGFNIHSVTFSDVYVHEFTYTQIRNSEICLFVLEL